MKRHLIYKGLLIALLLVFATACGSGGGKGPGQEPALKGTPPSVANLKLSNASLPVPKEGEQFRLRWSFDFEDPDGDIATLNVSLVDPAGTSRGGPFPFLPANSTGTYSGNFLIYDSYIAGTYALEVELKDGKGNSSGIAKLTFVLEAGAEPPLEITGISPVSGKPGDTLVITGKGFEEEASANKVLFKRSIAGAEIVSATAGRIEVIVPDGAGSGPVTLVTAAARTESPVSFMLEPMVSLSPAVISLVIDQSATFTCTVSGVETPGRVWSINGETVPAPTLGILDDLGYYTAPSSIPSENPLTLRCASSDAPDVFAEASVEIVLPLSTTPGEERVQVLTGGDVESPKGEVRITIPPDALTSDTTIRVEAVSPEELPTESEDTINLAAVRLEPSGLQFSQPVTVVFTLKNWEEPGTVLPLMLLDESTGGLVDTGETVVVNDTGMRAVGEIDHFSVYVVKKNVSLAMKQTTVSRFSALSPSFSDFTMETSPGLSFLEGLYLPVLIRYSGDGGGLGPFLGGVLVWAEYDGMVFGGTGDPIPYRSFLVQLSPDGWQMGVSLRIPVMTACGGGETNGATLFVAPPGTETATGLPDLGAAFLAIPFTVTCLDELNFDRSTDPAPIPPGGEVRNFSDGKYLYLKPGWQYRFSEIRIGEGGVLTTSYAVNQYAGATPLTIEVTDDVRIEGKIRLQGNTGSNGQNGRGADDGGDGGTGGSLDGGDGGDGGPQCLQGTNAFGIPFTDCSIIPEGEPGDSALNGGRGGDGGLEWERGEEFAIMWYYARFIYDLYVEDYRAAIEDAYNFAMEVVKLDNNETNYLWSVGGGGKQGLPNHFRQRLK